MKFFHHIKSRCVVYASLFALSLFLFSCEDVVEVDLASSDNRLVIDAEILWDTETSGNVQQIYLSRLTNYYETETTKVANAEVYITNTSGDTFTFTETDEAGTYQCNDFDPQLQETYQLFVNVDDETFTATESLITTPEINRIEQRADGGFLGEDYEVTFYYNDPVEEENFYLTDVEVDFLPLPEYDITSDDFFNGNEMDSDFSDEDLEPGDTLAIRFRAISEQFHSYMSLILESTSANPFGTPPANIRGNIINETNENNYALGYFRLSQVREFTYTVEEEQE